MKNIKTMKPQFGGLMTGTMIIDDLVNSLIGYESKNITTHMYGNVGVEIRRYGNSRVIMFPNLIVITCNDLATTNYYVYNNKSYEKFDIKSYADFYDKVSEDTGRELQKIFSNAYSQRKKKI